MQKILRKIVCRLTGHIYPYPRQKGSVYCFRCHEYLGERADVYQVNYIKTKRKK